MLIAPVSVHVLVFIECLTVMVHSKQRDQVFSWCITGQSHYNNQSVLSGIERTKYAGFHVSAPAGFKSRLCDYLWPNDAFCTTFTCHFHPLGSLAFSQQIVMQKGQQNLT